MKQAFGIFAALVLMPSFQVHAWLGGPWSNDTYQTNGDDGIYEAVATTSNGVGMYRWAVTNQAAGASNQPNPNPGVLNPAGGSNVEFGGLNGTVSSNVWYYKGLVYYGRCFGIVNSGWNQEFGIVSVTGNGSTDGAVGGIAINGTGTAGLAGPGTGNGVVTTAGGTQFGGGNNKGWCNSNFLARITQQYPQKRFKGKGVVSFFGSPDSSSETSTTTLNVDTNGDGVNDTVITTVHVELFGDAEAFSQVGHRKKFLVFGNQVSTQVFR